MMKINIDKQSNPVILIIVMNIITNIKTGSFVRQIQSNTRYKVPSTMGDRFRVLGLLGTHSVVAVGQLPDGGEATTATHLNPSWVWVEDCNEQGYAVIPARTPDQLQCSPCDWQD